MGKDAVREKTGDPTPMTAPVEVLAAFTVV
jgi:hypothetical protein